MKQFWIAIISDDPWSYLSGLPLPSTPLVLSGHFMRKRHAFESEVLIIANEKSWLTIDLERKIAISAPLKLPPEERILPIPWVSFKVELEAIHIFRDMFNIHPLYYSKLPFGFAFSPRREWLYYLQTKPEVFPKGCFAVADEASIRFVKYPLLRRVQFEACFGKILDVFDHATVIPEYEVSSFYILKYLSEHEINVDIVLLDIEEDFIQFLDKLHLTVKTVNFSLEENVLRELIHTAELSPHTYELDAYIAAVRVYLISRVLSNHAKIFYLGQNFIDVMFKILFPRLMAFPCFLISEDEKRQFYNQNIKQCREMSEYAVKVKHKLFKEMQKLLGVNVKEKLLQIFKQIFPLM